MMREKIFEVILPIRIKRLDFFLVSDHQVNIPALQAIRCAIGPTET
jgi:hypothetical protein